MPHPSLRVLHVITVVDDQQSYGGPLSVAVEHCAALRGRGHDARILAGWAGQGRAPRQLGGVPAHLFRVRRWAPLPRFSGLLSPRMLVWLARRARTFDVAHIHAARDLVPLLAAGVLSARGVRYVTQTHGMVMPDRRLGAAVLDTALTRPVLRRASSRLTLTSEEQQGLSAVIRQPVGATIRVGNGISSALPTQPRRQGAALDVLFMARLHSRKRVLDFGRAAQILAGEGVDATFSVVGPDDGQLAALRQLWAATPELTGRLRYEGPLPRPRALERLAQCDIFVLPSINEPFPMTLIEAMGLGRAIVCTESCGIADVIVDRGAGLVVPPSTRAVTDAIRKLVGDAGRRHQLGQAAKSLVEERFSIESVVDEIVRAYSSV